jgi:transaldolase
VELFIDTADLEEAQRATALGVITGCTTNPKLAAQAGPGDFRRRVMELLEICPGPLSVEVVGETVDEMLAEASDYAAWDPRIVVKIPMSLEALEAVSRLERERDIRVNVTCMVSPNQAMLAVLAGASYASLFVGRIADLGADPYAALRRTAEFIDQGAFKTRIIAGSVRQCGDIGNAFAAGAHIVTTPFKFLPELAHHSRTVETIAEFKAAWDAARASGELA